MLSLVMFILGILYFVMFLLMTGYSCCDFKGEKKIPNFITVPIGLLSIVLAVLAIVQYF